MKTNMKFGECLNFLLSDLDISINRLSKAINVDSSLVNRWVNGKRIPSYNTTYIESISEYLSKNINNSFQMQRLNEFFSTVCEDTEMVGNIKDKIKNILSESQGYSIECKKKMKEHATRSIVKEKIPKFLNYYKFDFNKEDNIKGENLTWDKYNPIPPVNLSNEDNIIIGSKNVLSTAISLLEAAANKKCRNNNTIYMTLINDLDLMSYNHNDLIHWRNVALKTINNGWNIVFLLRLNNNINRTIRFINFAQPLIKTGRFNPYYLKKYDDFNTGKEIIAVPEIGALLGLPTKPHSEIDCAFYLKNKIAIDIFRNYFSVLLSTFAEPLFKYYNTLGSNIEYHQCLTENEESIGNRFVYKNVFSVLTLPENLYKKLLKRKRFTHDEMLEALVFYRKHLNTFLSNIHNYEYKDIYLINCIENLIKHRQICFYLHKGIEILHLEVQDIIEHLKNIINLLETYDNYNIAFMHQNHHNIEIKYNFYCIVKERQAVMSEIYEPSKNIPEVRLSIEEPMLVKAFEEYFKEIWEQIPPVNKDKKEVINWIQSQINSLKNNYKENNYKEDN